jgi:selenocysteine lyase/cysteine desulfurase
VAALRDQRINIGTSSPDSTRLDSEARRLPILLRAAPHYYNTSEELDRLIVALTALPRQ